MRGDPLGEIRIGLVWHSVKAPNLGVGALTLANIEMARRAAGRLGLKPSFTVMGFGNEAVSYAPADVVGCHTIDSKFLLDPKGFRRVLDCVDCLLDIGAGDSFSDIYGWKRFMYIWSTKAIAAAKRKPLLLSPQTVGPFRRRYARHLAGWALRQADAVLVRDVMSMNVVRSLAPQSKATQSVDVAFALPYTPRKQKSVKPRIALNVSGMLFNEAEGRRNPFGLDYDYAEFTRALLQRLLAGDLYHVELITHVSAPQQPVDDDGAVADRLIKEFPKLRRAPPFSSPCDAKSYISGLEFLISGRMHSCIAAFSSNVPFVATSYSRKFEGLFGMLGYPGTLRQKGQTVEEALVFVMDWLDRRDQLTESIGGAEKQVEKLLEAYEATLVEFFRSARGSAV